MIFRIEAASARRFGTPRALHFARASDHLLDRAPTASGNFATFCGRGLDQTRDRHRADLRHQLLVIQRGWRDGSARQPP
jgi:hypothetical protein